MIEIAVEDVMRIQGERWDINRHDFGDIVWTFGGKPIKASAKERDHWMFVGLNNMDFITSNYLRHRPWQGEK